MLSFPAPVCPVLWLVWLEDERPCPGASFALVSNSKRHCRDCGPVGRKFPSLGWMVTEQRAGEGKVSLSLKKVREEGYSVLIAVVEGLFAPFPTALLPDLNILPASMFLQRG